MKYKIILLLATYNNKQLSIIMDCFDLLLVGLSECQIKFSNYKLIIID